jgi:hypothetical protein
VWTRASGGLRESEEVYQVLIRTRCGLGARGRLKRGWTLIERGVNEVWTRMDSERLDSGEEVST